MRFFAREKARILSQKRGHLSPRAKEGILKGVRLLWSQLSLSFRELTKGPLIPNEHAIFQEIKRTTYVTKKDNLGDTLEKVSREMTMSSKSTGEHNHKTFRLKF